MDNGILFPPGTPTYISAILVETPAKIDAKR